MSEEIYLSCDCGSHVLHVVRDQDDTDIEPYWYISFFSWGHRVGHNVRDKIRLIWHIVKEGHPYADDIILNNSEKKKLVEFLSEEGGNE